jgi:hypothetical protein
VDPKEAVSKHPAFEELPKFALHKRGDLPVPSALSGEERLQISSNNSIERVLFRIAWPVGGTECHEDIGECNWTRKLST